jgi:hypothetical protein
MKGTRWRASFFNGRNERGLNSIQDLVVDGSRAEREPINIRACPKLLRRRGRGGYARQRVTFEADASFQRPGRPRRGAQAPLSTWRYEFDQRSYRFGAAAEPPQTLDQQASDLEALEAPPGALKGVKTKPKI